MIDGNLHLLGKVLPPNSCPDGKTDVIVFAKFTKSSKSLGGTHFEPGPNYKCCNISDLKEVQCTYREKNVCPVYLDYIKPKPRSFADTMPKT